MLMDRRDFLKRAGASMVASIASPALVRAVERTTLRFVPQTELVLLDPIFTTAYVTRNHAYMVFDTLYGMDGTYQIRPQMLEGDKVENDGRLWTLMLRDGLLWHDGEKVLARDCVASIRRWAARDTFGSYLMAVTEELVAVDDRTIQFRLKRPFPGLRMALGKTTPPMCAMMPERLALTDPMKALTEMVGSGPFRYRAEEQQASIKSVYTKFEGYRPRDTGTPDWTAGPKVAHYDRVEWTTISDVGTASAALQAGEQDWLAYASPDLAPLLRETKGIRLQQLDPSGMVNMLRVNHLQPPFDNPAIRRALLGAFDQTACMEAIVGSDPASYRVPLGYFCPGTPMASEAGLETFRGPGDSKKTREELTRAGYANERIVLMVPADNPPLKALGDVCAELMKDAGLNVEYAAMDWASMLARRNKREPISQGGWHAFVVGSAGMDWLSPAVHSYIRGNGTAGITGWPTSARLEQLRVDWFEAPDEAAQRQICADIQKQCLVDVPYYPLGQYLQQTASRTSIDGILNGFPVFWNVRPA